MKRLNEFRFNDNMNKEVKAATFKMRNNFVKEVLKNHKSSYQEEICTVKTFDEAYDSSREVLNILLSGLYLKNTSKFERNDMQYKVSVMVRKNTSDYSLIAKYR